MPVMTATSYVVLYSFIIYVFILRLKPISL